MFTGISTSEEWPDFASSKGREDREGAGMADETGWPISAW